MSLEVRNARPADRPAMVQMLGKLEITFGGLSGPRLHEALCSSSEVVTAVAAQQGRLVGIGLVEVTHRWLLRHPLLAIRVATGRVGSYFRPPKPLDMPSAAAALSLLPALPAFVCSSPSPVGWSAPVPRVIFIAVESEFQGQGVGQLIYRRLFDELAAAGHNMLIARIARDNLRSLHLHAQTGWELHEDGPVILALKQLGPRLRSVTG